MVSINYAFKEIISKIVYYGPGLSGKTTNLQHVFKKVPKDTRGELISLATDADRTLYFDFLPVNVGNIRGFQVKFQLYTVPGQVYYNATRKLVLRGVDGLVFVADSQLDKMDENIESLKNLEENLVEYGYNLHEMPFVIQYNKRDLPNIATIEQLQAQLNPQDVPYYEAVAMNGSGVFATLKAISKLVIDKAQKSSSEKSESKTAVVAAVEPPPASPKPEPVAVSASTSEAKSQPSSKAAEYADRQSAAAAEKDNAGNIDLPVKSSAAHDTEAHGSPAQQKAAPVYGELQEEVVRPQESTEIDIEADAKSAKRAPEKPKIVKEAETLTNVVVSSVPEETEEEGDAESGEDIEETTEHAILKDETGNAEPHAAAPPKARLHHPDVLDADKLEHLMPRMYSRAEIQSEEPGKFDDEATVITDPRQTGQVFSKPQMAESVKVKGKKKAGLFGWLKKRNK